MSIAPNEARILILGRERPGWGQRCSMGTATYCCCVYCPNSAVVGDIITMSVLAAYFRSQRLLKRRLGLGLGNDRPPE
jgi:hypothetical protein